MGMCFERMPVRGYGNPAGRSSAIETVQAIYDAFARRDLDAALCFLAPDCEFLPAGTVERTPGQEGPYVGHDGVRRYFADAEKVWTELTLHAEDIRAAADGVVVFGHIDGIAGGERVRRRVIWMWRVSDGLVQAMRANEIGHVEPG